MTVYARGSSSVLRTISEGVNFPYALAFDGSKNLGSGLVLRSISQSVQFPGSLAFDAAGNLYVGNSDNSTITVYASGKKKLKRTISARVSYPHATSFGP